jgi:hypothetical protein
MPNSGGIGIAYDARGFTPPMFIRTGSWKDLNGWLALGLDARGTLRESDCGLQRPVWSPDVGAGDPP